LDVSENFPLAQSVEERNSSSFHGSPLGLQVSTQVILPFVPSYLTLRIFHLLFQKFVSSPFSVFFISFTFIFNFIFSYSKTAGEIVLSKERCEEIGCVYKLQYGAM